MAQEASPAFQFYVKEWRSSRSIMRMSMAERGMYLEMLLEQWENLALPDSPDECFQIIGGRLAEWRKAWPVLRRRFVVNDQGTGIFNIRLDFERSKQRSRARRSEDRGKLGAAARWSKSKTGEKLHEPDTASIQQASPNDAPSIREDGFPIPIATSIPIAIASAPRARQSGRIYLHRWQLENLISTLGPHSDDFGLDDWLERINERIAGQALPRDPWKFVQAELHAEIARRGLAVAEASTAAPTNKRIAGLMAGGEAFLKRVADGRQS